MSQVETTDSRSDDAQPFFDLRAFVPDQKALARRFATAKPFPHLVLDNVLSASPDVMGSWPAPEWPHWRGLGDSYQRNKKFCQDIRKIPGPFADLIAQLTQPEFLSFLETVTGIEKLIPDPHLEGGGLHLSGPGGILAPHTDFHTYSRLDLFRRVNVLVYLNEGWTKDDGGYLQLVDPDDDAQVVDVLPTWGTCVIFETNDRSVHGFPVPVVEGKWRRSVALYYYTAAEAAEFSGDGTTYWREHGENRGLRRVRLALYRSLLGVSRGFSIAAHLVNPNQGLELVKTRLRNMRAARKLHD
ncbi:MAG: hypothetical protein QOF60_1184 [Actinomycetota bacterium]|jgi:hypothetical protein|nr:hypothetical protein [Actinomycetota bacterium]